MQLGGEKERKEKGGELRGVETCGHGQSTNIPGISNGVPDMWVKVVYWTSGPVEPSAPSIFWFQLPEKLRKNHLSKPTETHGNMRYNDNNTNCWFKLWSVWLICWAAIDNQTITIMTIAEWNKLFMHNDYFLQWTLPSKWQALPIILLLQNSVCFWNLKWHLIGLNAYEDKGGWNDLLFQSKCWHTFFMILL